MGLLLATSATFLVERLDLVHRPPILRLARTKRVAAYYSTPPLGLAGLDRLLLFFRVDTAWGIRGRDRIDGNEMRKVEMRPLEVLVWTRG